MKSRSLVVPEEAPPACYFCFSVKEQGAGEGSCHLARLRERSRAALAPCVGEGNTWKDLASLPLTPALSRKREREKSHSFIILGVIQPAMTVRGNDGICI
jgi:hypothetical protein